MIVLYVRIQGADRSVAGPAYIGEKGRKTGEGRFSYFGAEEKSSPVSGPGDSFPRGKGGGKGGKGRRKGKEVHSVLTSGGKKSGQGTVGITPNAGTFSKKRGGKK